MNVKQAVRLIRKHRPTTTKEFNSIGVKLERKLVGSGVFREVVKVVGLPLVVKFPLAETIGQKLSYRAGKMHSSSEVRKIQKLRKIRAMRSYLPTVYYYDTESGIVVMSHHEKFLVEEDALIALGKLTSRALRQWTGVTISDIHGDNVRRGRSRRQIIFVDIGY